MGIGFSVALERLEEAVRRTSGLHVARESGVSQPTIVATLSGKSVPKGARRAALSRYLGVSEQDWATSAPPSTVRPPQLTAVQPGTLGTTLAEVEANVLELKENLRRAKEDPKTSIQERMAITRTIDHALRHLSKVRGETEISRAQILRSPHWAALLEAISVALGPFPEAALAVAKAMRELAGT
jgi:transcriptional regulator with XRE-family HTH domain